MPVNQGIQGLAAALKALETVRDAVKESELKKIVKEAADPMLQSAKSACPVGPTGRLKAQLHTEVTAVGKQRRIAIANIGNTKETWYGVFVEFGAYERPGVGFMRQAFDGGKQKAESHVRERLQNEVMKVATKVGKKSVYDTTHFRDKK
jgi:HK97 gp10 family phage protein